MRLIALVLVSLAAACGTLTIYNTGGDAAADLDIALVMKLAASSGAEERARIEVGSLEVIAQESVAMDAAKTAFSDAILARNKLLAHSAITLEKKRREGSQFDDRFSPLIGRVRDALDDSTPRIDLLATDAPYAVTFSDQSIVISRRFVDGLLGETIDSNHWSLRFVAAHEIVHLYDGHALFNWLATRGKSYAELHSSIRQMSFLTRALPLRIDYQYSRDDEFSRLESQPIFLEFFADYWAYYLLKEMGAPPGSASAALNAIAAESSASSHLVQDALRFDRLLDRRAKCMELLDAANPSVSSFRISKKRIWGPNNPEIYWLADTDVLKPKLRTVFERGRISNSQRQTALDAFPELLSDVQPSETSLDVAFWFCAHAAESESGLASGNKFSDLADRGDWAELFASTAGEGIWGKFKLWAGDPQRPLLVATTVTEGGLRPFEAHEAFARRKRFILAEQNWRENAGQLPPSPSLPGQAFRDCADCPELVVLPVGEFIMGSPIEEVGRQDDEGPQRKVVIERPFALGRFPVTAGEWRVCAAEGGCVTEDYEPNLSGRSSSLLGDHTEPERGSREAMVNVSWDDAAQYVRWLNHRVGGHPYRLPTEVEWEYAARAGSSSAYYWGPEVGEGNALCDRTCDNRRILAVGNFPPNAFGLFDMVGLVGQHVEDQCVTNYAISSNEADPLWRRCLSSEKLVRGRELRVASRQRLSRGAWSGGVGFRVLRAL